MRRYFFILVVLLSAASVFATETDTKRNSSVGKKELVQKDTVQSQAVEVGNKICPVSGEKIVPKDAGTIEYHGKIYNLCCQMCIKDFKKNPQKYADIADKETKNSSQK